MSHERLKKERHGIMRIVVIAGGLSPERDVSLSSGSLIANALIERGYEVCLVDLYMGVGDIEHNGVGLNNKHIHDFDDMFVNSNSTKRYSYNIPPHEPDLDKLRNESNNGGSLIGKNVIEICRAADLAFLALHGDMGENGKLQAIFDSYGITYTGTGYIGSLLAMDKDLAKLLMVQNHILTPKWETIELSNNDNGGINNKKPITHMAFPLVIKPCSCGSSVGVSIVRNEDEYGSAIEYARRYEKKIIVEELIKGREFSVGVLDNTVLPVIEIIPKEGFYDYKNKYQSGLTDEVCPADLDMEITKKVQDIALKVHKVLRLGSYSRIDFIMDESSDFYCLEANTLPGMTPMSLLPQEAKAVGIEYGELCDIIVRCGMLR